ncbi:MAG: tetratricopeptide repeat protein [Proteobacteria bacterium]|nr:tetratricopeptide repeat protein [Pseudomonadota bacterium]
MWQQTVVVWGWEIAFGQLVVVVSFAALLLGYLLAMAINRRQRESTGRDTFEDKERMTSNMAFISGINYILSGKTDQAIEELTRAVSVDTDTVETYVALANLFRARGDIDRAIRIRQTIILRKKLDAQVRRQARFDLGLDYRKGGFYDRAVQTFEELVRDEPKRVEPYLQLIEIFEETRDWSKAFEMEQKVARLTGSRAGNVQAHLQVEMGKEVFEKGNLNQARSHFKKALSLDPACVDAYLHLGDLLLGEGKLKKAVSTWRKVAAVAPDMAFLTFGRLARVSPEAKDLKAAVQFLAETAVQDRNPMAHLTLARLLERQGDHDGAIEHLETALERDPSLYEARRELGTLLLSLDRREAALNAYRDFLEHLTAPEVVFQCGHCGYESRELAWRCPHCSRWDTMTLQRHRPLLFDPREAPAVPTVPADPPSEDAADEEPPSGEI